MKFEEMCRLITKGERGFAYRRSYPDITTLVGLGPSKGGMIMFYYDHNQQAIPFVINNDIVSAEDWEVCDEYEDRFNIRNFMTMPKAKEFLLEVYDFYNSANPSHDMPESFSTIEYKRRMSEAGGLRLLYPDMNAKRIMITDLGYDLIKQLDK